MKNKLKKPEHTVQRAARMPAWAGAGIVCGVVVAFLWPVLAGKWFIWFDFINQHIPRNAYIAQAFARGYLPQWDITSYGGAPFLADPENAVFFPFNWLLVLGVSNGALHVLALQRLVVVEVIIAALCMFMTLRELGARSEGAAFGALAWVLSAPFVCRFMNYAHFTVIMCIPGVLWMLFRWGRLQTLAAAAAAGVALGIAFLGGNPQYMYFLALVVGLHAGCTLGERIVRGTSWQTLAWLSGGYVLMAALALGIAAVNLLPIAQFFAISQREAGNIAAGTGTPLKYVICYVLPQLFGRVSGGPAPYSGHEGFWNYWEYSLYVGLVPLALGIWGAVRLRGQRERIFLIVLVAFAWLYAFGQNNPLPQVLPFGRSMRIPGKFLIFAAFGLCTLAGLAFDRVVAALQRRGFGVAAVVVALVMIGDAWVNNRAFNAGKDDPRQMYPDIPQLAALRAEMRREHVRMDGRPFTAGNLRALYYGLENMDGFAALVAQNVTEVRGVRGVSEARFNDLWNVKYVFSPQRGFIARTGYVPRAFVVRKLRRVERANLVQALSAPEFDPRAEALVTAGASREVGGGTAVTGDTVMITSYAPERIEVKAALQSDGVLVMSENALPGWRVRMDGKPAKWMEVNGCFRAVEVPAGAHEVVWEYCTPGLHAGAAISAASLGTVAGAGLVAWRRRRAAA